MREWKIAILAALVAVTTAIGFLMPIESPVSAADATTVPAAPTQIRCRPVLGGLINDYDVAA